jgi:hypothetical protein
MEPEILTNKTKLADKPRKDYVSSKSGHCTALMVIVIMVG